METKPKIEIDLKRVESLAGRGLTKEKIAEALGISQATLYIKQREDPEFLQAITRGRAKAEAIVADKLWENATKRNNVTAQIFYLKSRCGWSEKSQVEVTNAEPVKIIIKNDL